MRVMSWNTSWNCKADRIARQIDAVGELVPDVSAIPRMSLDKDENRAHSGQCSDDGIDGHIAAEKALR